MADMRTPASMHPGRPSGDVALFIGGPWADQRRQVELIDGKPPDTISITGTPTVNYRRSADTGGGGLVYVFVVPEPNGRYRTYYGS